MESADLEATAWPAFSVAFAVRVSHGHSWRCGVESEIGRAELLSWL